jgi:osmotically inducible lipoprotein OsmB
VFNGFERHSFKEHLMNTRLAISLASAILALSLGACGNMSARDRNTTTGAAVGGVAGAILTGGSAAGTVGGAVVGGVIGNKVDPKDKK